VSRNRYVGDYRLIESIDGHGRIKTDYEYIGAAYCFAEGAVTARRLLRRALLLCALGWLAFVGALVPLSAASRTLWVSLPFAFAAVPLALMTATLFRTQRTAEPLEHRHADQLENRCPACSFFVALLSGIALAGEGVNLLRRTALLRGDIAFSLGAAVLLSVGLCCHRLWKRLKCRKAE